MKLTEYIKDLFIPLVSVGTAVMVGVLNHQVSVNDHELRLRDQQLDERLSDIDLLVKQSKEEREERESTQNFNLRIYDIVTQSLEESNPKKQEAAKAFVVVMVEEPLRSSLLNVLKQGGDATVSADISRILEQEGKFQSKVYTAPVKKREIQPSYAWGEWDFDIFWCADSGSAAKKQAEIIAEQLVDEGSQGRVRIRELPESINAKSGYQVDGYAIRRSSDEVRAASALKKLAEAALKDKGMLTTFRSELTTQSTPWYISVFICPRP